MGVLCFIWKALTPLSHGLTLEFWPGSGKCLQLLSPQAPLLEWRFGPLFSSSLVNLSFFMCHMWPGLSVRATVLHLFLIWTLVILKIWPLVELLLPKWSCTWNLFWSANLKSKLFIRNCVQSMSQRQEWRLREQRALTVVQGSETSVRQSRNPFCLFLHCWLWYGKPDS